ncbi:hypothetical protein EON67_02515 [archaeon]|nr:MAG: hypothetical protein EON67_02515 [archaeon]
MHAHFPLIPTCVISPHRAVSTPVTFTTTMPKKRRNNGRNRHGRGRTHLVLCEHCLCKPAKVSCHPPRVCPSLRARRHALLAHVDAQTCDM